MRLNRVWLPLCLLVVVGVVLTQAQDNEDSPAPKRVLKKYRVRRPVIVDDQGNVVRAGPRLRRVRVKNPKTTTSTSTSTSTSTTVGVSSSVTPTVVTSVQSSPQPQLLRQRASPNAIQQERRVQLQEQQPRQVVYEDQGVVVDQVRTVPTFRQATPLKNREEILANVHYKPSRGTSSSGDQEDRKLGTTRNYSRINEDGSFTFGYEAEDGSFKEETRGVDCVVRGKYGYIDPDGVRREFEYVSGNPCDPNDPDKGEEQEEEEVDSLAPSKPILRQRVRPTELNENNIQGQQQTLEERLPEDQLVNFRQAQQQSQRQRIRTSVERQPQPQRARVTTPAPQPVFNAEPEEDDEPAFIVRQRPFPAFPSARPSIFQEPSQSLEEQQRPSAGFGRFNFDDEVQRLARPHNQPQPLYEQPFRQVVHSPQATGRQIFGNTAFHREQAQPSPAPTSATSTSNPNFGRYRNELVYDRNTGQYTSVLVQSNPNTNQEFELTQKLRAFVEPTPTPTATPTFSSPTFTTPTGSGAYTQIQQFGQPQIQYYHQSQPQNQGRVASPQPSQRQQDPSQIDQFLARHAYQPQKQQQQQQQQQQQRHQQQQLQQDTLQFIPPHLRPGAHQTAEIQRQEVQEIDFPSRAAQQNQGFSGNSASSANGQIDAFLRALNISI